MRAPNPPSTGFLCACGGKTMCIDSRQNKNGSTRRRRKCLECGGRFSTYEVEFAKYRAFLKQLNALSKQASAIIRGIGPDRESPI